VRLNYNYVIKTKKEDWQR